MKLVTLKCPNCGADIEIENGIDTFYCKYCGYKIILDGQSDAAINAKVRMKELESNERIKREKWNYKREATKENNKTVFKVLAILFGVMLFCIAMVIILGVMGDKEAEAQDKKFQTIVDEIMIDIDNGNFDEARVKANMLYWDSSSNPSASQKKKWDQTRKEILKQIDKAEKEAKKKEKTGWFG